MPSDFFKKLSKKDLAVIKPAIINGVLGPFEYNDPNMLWIPQTANFPSLKGCECLSRWVECTLDSAASAAIISWQSKSNAKVGTTYHVPHVTVLYGHDPTARRAMRYFVKAMPRNRFYLGDIVARPVANPTHYVAPIKAPSVKRWMQCALGNPALWSGHPDWKAHDGYGVPSGLFKEAFPHITLLSHKDGCPPHNPPLLGKLAVTGMELRGIYEFIEIKLPSGKTVQIGRDWSHVR